VEFLVPFLFPGLFFLYTWSLRNEALQDVQEVQPPEFHEACQQDPQAQRKPGEPDARRYSAVGHGETPEASEAVAETGPAAQQCKAAFAP